MGWMGTVAFTSSDKALTWDPLLEGHQATWRGFYSCIGQTYSSLTSRTSGLPIELTEAEASFRALKSELSIRPLFHRLESRVKAHVMVAFLGYGLWVTLKHLLKRRPAIVPQPSSSGVNNAQPLSAMKALSSLAHTAPTSSCPPPMDERSACAASPNRPPSRNRSSSNSGSASPRGSNFIANVV